MTPAKTAAILRQFNDHRRGCDVPNPKPSQIGRAIDAAVEMIERMESALRLIAETDPIDAALDPQRAIRVASAALEELK